MASVTMKHTKDGHDFYEIRCHHGRGKPTLSTRWYVPEGWSKKSIERELQKVAAEFERQVKAGEVLTVKERKKLAADAEAKERKIKTFRQYCEQVYIPSLEVTAAKHTLSNFKGNFKNHIYPRLGEMKITDISAADIRALLLAEQKDLKIDSVVKIYTILKLVFKNAYLEEIIEKNPMDRVERPSAKKEEIITETAESYTPEEAAYILECLNQEPYQWQCYVRLLIDTGCRRGEACGLQWGDIDFDDDRVDFNRQLCYTPEDGVYVDTLKNRKKRKVFIDPDLTEMLKTLRKLKTNKKVVDIQKAKNDFDDQYIFTQIISESKKETIYSDLPMHPDTPTRYFKKFGERYNINHFHPHKCRHTQASVAITNGADVVSVSQKLGHSDVSVTLRIYAHASDESQKKASEKFRSALKEAKAQDKQAK